MHQLDEDANGVAVLGGLTLALHVAAAAAATLALAGELSLDPPMSRG